ncbi:MAG: acyltransferase [Rhodococcus sp. (in: high G+C Gram-positive bacteria)]|jgi:putative colanic acid biosynthesis acetyltransferase WcaF|uniref:acyltransferase n=1 Tax=Rhodococcus sp. EPR-157 TaxID=1813677 RepID=UPI0007BC1A1D|nr:acyltransferase [Rhodococcus sp. EPR-157]KZF09501.1 acetyltransferase [Rhodococcus sp. EPR-157]
MTAAEKPAAVPEVHHASDYKMQDISLARKIRNRIGTLGFNMLVTYIPSHIVRQNFLRAFGAKIGKDTSIFRGTTILDIENLVIGEACSIGFRCMFDARGGITIGDNVVIASDTHIIGGYHDHNDPAFKPILEPTFIGDYVWIASRCTVLSGSNIGRGAVVGGCSMVRGTVNELEVVAGTPAKVRSMRDPNALAYRPKYRPLFY